MTKNEKGLNGVYLHGGVGRGKSMLMDLFFDAVKKEKKSRRVHFHAFMIETHEWLHAQRGRRVDNLLPAYARDVAKNVEVLCFDEFFVTDVADAMILSRLFTALFERGVAIVVTSNWVPERLYEGGLQRDLFLPFIALLKERMDVVHLDSERDYRAVFEQDRNMYFWPLGHGASEKADDLFAGLTDCAPPEKEILKVKGREICIRAANGVARCPFSQLCEQPRGAEDYIRIADKYHTLFLEGVPKLGYDRRNEAKRFMSLVDVLYDKGRHLVVTADAPPDRLYSGHDHAFEFDRTVSRLREMQSSAYGRS